MRIVQGCGGVAFRWGGGSYVQFYILYFFTLGHVMLEMEMFAKGPNRGLHHYHCEPRP